MDPLGALPPFVLLSILRVIPDLPSLQNLRSASASVNRILQEDGIAAEVIEGVLSSGSMIMSTRFLIRTTALLIWGPPPGNVELNSHESFRNILDGKLTGTSPPFGQDPQLPGCQHLKSWDGLPVTTLLRLIALSKQVQKLIHHCFHTLLDRVLASKPRRLVDPMIDLRPFFQMHKHAKAARLPLPPPFPDPPSELVIPTPAAMEPPAWGELQILEHCAWLFAIYSVVQTEPGTNPAGENRDVWWPFAQDHLAFQEFWKSARHVFIGLDAVQHIIPWSTARIPEVIRDELVCDNNSICCKTSGIVEAEEARRDTDPWKNYRGRLYHAICRESHFFGPINITWMRWSPIYQASEKCWDHLGFSVWTNRRMAALGFMVHTDKEMWKSRTSGRSSGGKLAE